MNTLTLQQTAAATQQEPDPATQAIGELMQRYCQAVDACETIPMISIWPGIKTILRLYLWTICFDLMFITALIDLPLLLLRCIFGRPRFVVGRFLYRYTARPFISAWEGEIPAFKIVRVRYLSRMFLFYRAESHINDLHNAFNRRHLGMLTEPSKREQHETVAAAEDFQKTFDLFQKIISNTYQLKLLAVGGPLVALLAVFVNNAAIPLVTYSIGKLLQLLTGNPEFALTSQFLGGIFNYVVIFLICLMWVLVSTWMDTRSALLKLDVPRFERAANSVFQLRGHGARPADIVVYLLIFGAAFAGIIVTYYEIPGSQELLGTYGFPTLVMIGLGLVALGRRLWLGRAKLSADP